jgi:excisionase family DNA binding protein
MMAVVGGGAMATVAEVAEVPGVSRWSVYERIRRSEIPVVEVGRSKRIPRAWLDEQGAAVPADRLEAVERRLEELSLMLAELGRLVGDAAQVCFVAARQSQTE